MKLMFARRRKIRLALDEVEKETFFISKSYNNFLRFIKNLSSSGICFLIKSIIFMLISDFIAKLALAQIGTQKVSSLLLDVVLNKIFFCRKK